MKTIILARVSSEEKKEAGNSLPVQQAPIDFLSTFYFRTLNWKAKTQF